MIKRDKNGGGKTHNFRSWYYENKKKDNKKHRMS